MSLSGCLDPAATGSDTNPPPAQKPGFLSVLASPRPGVAPLRHAVLAQGDVVVAGPDGYCIDRVSLRRQGKGGFALLAACQALSKGGQGRAVDPAILTVTVLPPRAGATVPSADALAQSLADRGILARAQGKGFSLVHLASGGDQLSPAGDPRYWRAAMMVNGHLVGLAVYAPKGSRIAGPGGQRLIVALAEQVQAHSAAAAQPAAAPAPAAVPPDTPVAAWDTAAPNSPKGLKKPFPKLFQ